MRPRGQFTRGCRVRQAGAGPGEISRRGASEPAKLCRLRLATGVYRSPCGGAATDQKNRARAAALARRDRSCAVACSSSAARSASSTEPWVGRTQAVGQRVIPLVRMNSAITVSQSSTPPVRFLSISITGALRLPRSPISNASRGITVSTKTLTPEPPKRPPIRQASAAGRSATLPSPLPGAIGQTARVANQNGDDPRNSGALSGHSGPSAPPARVRQKFWSARPRVVRATVGDRCRC
jgi:hypothetical protein